MARLPRFVIPDHPQHEPIESDPFGLLNEQK